MQRRSTNIKSERGSGEIDLKTFYLPVRDTEIAPERCRASASPSHQWRQQEIFRSKLKGLALICVPLVFAMARPRPPSAVVSGSAGRPSAASRSRLVHLSNAKHRPAQTTTQSHQCQL